jgi:hypothetical protein
MCKGNTAAGGSGVLWTGREFGVRIYMGLFVLTVELVIILVTCFGRKFNTGEDLNI